jgi:hypothetical protein
MRIDAYALSVLIRRLRMERAKSPTQYGFAWLGRDRAHLPHRGRVARRRWPRTAEANALTAQPSPSSALMSWLAVPRTPSPDGPETADALADAEQVSVRGGLVPKPSSCLSDSS